MANGYDLPDIDFDCPNGETAESVMRLPSLPKQALNLTRATWRSILSVLTRWQLRTPKRERNRRLSICKGNADDCYRAGDGRCTACGCFVAAKAALKPEQCPNGHW